MIDPPTPRSSAEPATLDHTLTATSDASRPHRGHDEGHPTTLGRYQIRGVLGRGGMGIVYAALDPELDREVALKVLTGRRDANARARLRREARTLAKLAHPNVVAVHDVGEEQGRLYLAMAKVEGSTLRAHLAAAPRPWPSVLALFVAAGRGLVAAHEAGLVHRDFKPDNVLIDASGAPRVVDFGLARVIEDAREQTETSPGDTDEHELHEQALTRPGAIMGTPAYMAPEQHLGDETDARTDQFALCVSLWEALYGERPFPGSNVAALAQAVIHGRVSVGPRRGVPRAIRTILLRGLESDPRRRWPSLADLLDALEAVPRRRRSIARASFASVLGIGLVAGTWALADAPTSAAAPALCVDTSAPVDAIWSAERRATIGAALDRVGGSEVGPTRTRVQDRLDAYADALREGFAAACLDTELRQLVSPELRDRRVACLGERLDALAATADLLETIDRASLRQATRVVEELPEVAACSDLERVAARLPEPSEPTQVAALATARRELAAAKADLAAVRIEAAGAAIERAQAAFTGVDHRPFALELDDARARLLTLRGEHEAAADALREVYHAAFALGHDELASAASLELIVVLGLDLDDPEQGLAWARHAESLVEREADPIARATLLDARGKLHQRRGEHEQAAARFEDALVIRRRELGPRSVEVAASLNDLSSALDRLGRTAEAKAALAEAIEIKLETLGEFSSSTAGSLTNMGMLLWREHEYEQAAAHHRHALAVFERAYGPDHRSVAGTSLNLGMALHSLGRAGEALPVLERGLAIVRESGGPPDLEAKLLGSIGAAHYQLRAWAPAREAYASELELVVAREGEGSPALAGPLLGLAEVAHGEGRHADAIALATRVLALQPADEPAWEQGFDAHLTLAEAQLGLGRRALAREHARLARDGFATIGGRRSDEAREAEALIVAIDGATDEATP